MQPLGDRLSASRDDHSCRQSLSAAPTQAGARFYCLECGGLFREARA